MEHSRSYGRRGLQMGNIIGDPFALATLSVGMLAWFICFVACIVGQIQSESFPKFSWWAVIFALFINVGVFVVVASDAVQTYHVALSSYLAAGLVLSSSSVNALVYSNIGARQAAGAGFILLSMLDIVWIFYFGSTPSSTPRAFLDSFALSKESSTNMNRQPMTAYGGTGRPETSNSVQPPQMYTSAQLNGFENSNPLGNTMTGARTSNFGTSTPQQSQQPAQVPLAKPAHDAEVVPPTEYPYKAKAIYSYDANPDDANEISFSKHEILEVSDVSGRWWQARKENGETGIAPSNYLILL
ncbi:high osmolarity signaling protein Sho1, putative [Cordyceps militaris CM01]|uniref:High osmolarity signaling protein Sho1, putative n=2 Tax=Cordyceps militaris TaxID=73501 RepID=G3JF71_CORMM|nr:high osmolarity signaling protein Sho1, putative [Cordyceps militaris CM01]ATY64507.1 high osmolarity signaling [Cordyceps militaris]EGX93511.1 high osmolarity signaling protein Sho1, putative [Cordyceps militaris CM01]